MQMGRPEVWHLAHSWDVQWPIGSGLDWTFRMHGDFPLQRFIFSSNSRIWPPTKIFDHALETSTSMREVGMYFFQKQKKKFMQNVLFGVCKAFSYHFHGHGCLLSLHEVPIPDRTQLAVGFVQDHADYFELFMSELLDACRESFIHHRSNHSKKSAIPTCYAGLKNLGNTSSLFQTSQRTGRRRMSL